MSVAEGSCASPILPIEAQQTKEDKASTINHILEPEISLGTDFVKLPQMIIFEPLFSHQRHFDFLSCKEMYKIAYMGSLYDCCPCTLEHNFFKMKQKHIEISVKKNVLFMQNMSDKVIKQSIKNKEDELFEAEWESGDDDNSRDSEYGRNLKLREEIPD